MWMSLDFSEMWIFSRDKGVENKLFSGDIYLLTTVSFSTHTNVIVSSQCILEMSTRFVIEIGRS